jgi:hypothetical protein
MGYVDQRNAGAKAPPSLEVGMHVNAGDTAWMLTSTALVFFMMPGLALFYGGLVRFQGYLVFIGLWSLIVYSPFAHAERSKQADMTGQRSRPESLSSSGE